MKRRDTLKALALSGLMLPMGATSTVASSNTDKLSKPNIVFFLVDDLGWTDLGCFGSSFYETPNIDRLCASGMKFTQAYAACPVCSPTRASIMTGKYPARTGITTYINQAGGNQPEKWKRNTKLLPASYEDRMTLDEVTLAEALKKNGYSTFFAGKWHLGPESWWPEDQGFDVNQGGIERGGPYGGKRYFSPYGNPRLKDGPDGEHLPDRLATEASAFIKDHNDKPFMTYLSFYSVHTPLMARDDLRKKYEEKAKTLDSSREVWGAEGPRKSRLIQDHAIYGGMVEAVDLAVGKVLDTLDEQGLTENTIIFFMSDNGGLSTSEGHPTSNAPLRAGKGWIYEGGIREPMIVRAPGITKPGSTCHQPIISNDFYPTILELAGLPLRQKQHCDGKSFSPLLQGKALERGPLFWHFPHYGNQGCTPSAAVRDGDWKLIEWYEDRLVELYNLKDDLGEQTNLAETYPDKVKELHTKLREWRQSVNANMPTLNPNYKI